MRYLCHPLGDYTQTSGYRAYTYMDSPGTWPHHCGKLDMPCPEGTAVYSMTDGVVQSIWTEPNGTTGMNIKVTTFGAKLVTGKDVIIRYIHWSQSLVQQGDTVRAGQKIALSGDRGSPNQYHLHVDMYWDQAGGACQENAIRLRPFSSIITPYYNFEARAHDTIELYQSSERLPIDDYLIYHIFTQDIIKVNEQEEGTTIIKPSDCHVPNSYYTDTISENQITGSYQGEQYSRERMIDMISALSIREVTGYISGTISDYQASELALYGKLLRGRCIYYPNDSLLSILWNGGFSGFNEQRLADWCTESERLKVMEIVSRNMIYPDAFRIQDRYISIAEYGPYFNYGYSGEGYINSPNVEGDIRTGILNLTLPSHIKNGNTTKLCGNGVCGNTAYFPPRSWT